MKPGPVWLVPFEFGQLIAPAAYLGGAIVVGLLIYRFLFKRLKRAATLTSWGGDDVLIAALHDVALIWFAAGGAYAALRSMPLRDDVSSTIERTLLGIVIASGTFAVARLVGDLIKLTVLRTGTVRGQSSLLVNVARVLVFLVGLLILLEAIGIRVTALLTALGVGGLAVALAMQDTLANLFAGIQILASKKIQPGDYVLLDSGEEGYVVDIDWRNTTIRQLPNNHQIIPNSKLAAATVTNFYRPEREMSIRIQVGVSYASDLEHVERVTIEVARAVMAGVEGGVPEFDPFIRFHTFGDSSIDFTAILRTREFTDQYLVTHEFVKQLHRRYNEEGIEIPFPIRTVMMPGASDEQR